MLQWLPGSKTEVIWNDRQDEMFVSHILDVFTGDKRTLPAPIYALSPDGHQAVFPDFRRLNDMRPGYGYAGIPDPNTHDLAPASVGIWRLNLQTGETELLLSFADIVDVPNPHGDWSAAKHWFNHLLVSPDGARFIFLHRWRKPGQQGFSTRMLTADQNGENLYVVDPFGGTSHFIWRDPQHVLAWAYHPSCGEKFYLYKDQSDEVRVVAPDLMTLNGHCTYLPGQRWILNDTYPHGERHQDLYLYDTESQQRHDLGQFYAPPAYVGEWRCDLHPRFSPNGKQVVIDSAHSGHGRQLYLIDISSVVS